MKLVDLKEDRTRPGLCNEHSAGGKVNGKGLVGVEQLQGLGIRPECVLGLVGAADLFSGLRDDLFPGRFDNRINHERPLRRRVAQGSSRPYG